MGEAVAVSAGPGSPHAISATDEQPMHRVCVPEFWLGKTELTWEQWSRVTELSMPASVRPQQAAFNISWHDVQVLVEKLAELARSKNGTAQKYRLPSEAEWEYACRAGERYPLFNGDSEARLKHIEYLGRYAWFNVPNFPDRWAHDVAKKHSNAWGLHDLLGNVHEWVQDSYDPEAYARHRQNAPVVSSDASMKVIRGGSYRSKYSAIRCGERNHASVEERLPIIGVRLVVEK